MQSPRPARGPAERLQEAWRLFQWSTDPQIIDKAIHAMCSAEKALGLSPDAEPSGGGQRDSAEEATSG